MRSAIAGHVHGSVAAGFFLLLLSLGGGAYWYHDTARRTDADPVGIEAPPEVDQQSQSSAFDATVRSERSDASSTGQEVGSDRRRTVVRSPASEEQAAPLVEEGPATDPPVVELSLRTQGGAEDLTPHFVTAMVRDPAAALEELGSRAEELCADPGLECQVVELLPSWKGPLDPAARTALDRLYEQAHGAALQREAARVLSRCGDDALVDRYVADRRASARSQDSELRADTAAELAGIESAAAFEELVRLLGDENSEVVEAALSALLVSNGSSAAPRVRPLLEHERRSVRNLAAAALARWAAEDATGG